MAERAAPVRPFTNQRPEERLEHSVGAVHLSGPLHRTLPITGVRNRHVRSAQGEDLDPAARDAPVIRGKDGDRHVHWPTGTGHLLWRITGRPSSPGLLVERRVSPARASRHTGPRPHARAHATRQNAPTAALSRRKGPNGTPLPSPTRAQAPAPPSMRLSLGTNRSSAMATRSWSPGVPGLRQKSGSSGSLCHASHQAKGEARRRAGSGRRAPLLPGAEEQRASRRLQLCGVVVAARTGRVRPGRGRPVACRAGAGRFA
jgi:hypothetical protein